MHPDDTPTPTHAYVLGILAACMAHEAQLPHPIR
jgi:hypothetical protein